MLTAIGVYRIESQLGQGGQASVYQARGPGGEPVAVKVWTHLGAEPERVRRRIERESALVAAIDHPCVVRLVEARPDAEIPYLVFDFVDGVDLGARVRESGPLRGPAARDLVIRLLDGLVEIHAAGIAHLDLKPGNVMFTTEEDGTRPVVIDFGIARSMERTSTRWSGQTTPFASPEQLQLESAHTPSDVFSWASLVYYALTGLFPFGEEPARARANILDPDQLPDRRPFDAAVGSEAPPLWDILVGAWHRDPVLRWPLFFDAATGARVQRPTADTKELLNRVANAFGAPAGSRYRVGRVHPHRAGPTGWHELGAHLRHRRRHGLHPMTRRQMAAQRELRGRIGAFGLLLMEFGWREPGYEVVASIDEITGAEGYLRHLYACARTSEGLGLLGRPRGNPYPLAGDVSEQHEDTPLVLRVAPWQRTSFPLVLRNVGTVEWHDRALRPVGPVIGTETVPLRGEEFPVPATAPGELARVDVPIKAPGWPGIYRQRLKMVDAAGRFCFPGVNTLGMELMIQVVPDEPR